jgi:hypothetical protein
VINKKDSYKGKGEGKTKIVAIHYNNLSFDGRRKTGQFAGLRERKRLWQEYLQ